MNPVVDNYKEKWAAHEPIRREFYERLYKWASADLEREVSQNFRLARKVKGSLAQSNIAVAESMSLDERRAIFGARFNQAFSYRLGEKLTSPEQDALSEEFRRRWREYTRNPDLSGYPKLPSKISREGWRKLLRDKLCREELGDFGWWDRPTEWYYRLRIGEWFVVTHIDTGGRSRQLEFGHVIESPITGSVPVTGNQKNIELSDGRINCLTVLGFSSQWDRLTPEDLPEAVDDLIALIQHFMKVVPELLKGIDPPPA